MYFLQLPEKSHKTKLNDAVKRKKKVGVLHPNVVNVYNRFVGKVDRKD